MKIVSTRWLGLVLILTAISGCWWFERIATDVSLEGKDVSGLTERQAEYLVQKLAHEDPDIKVPETVAVLLEAQPGTRVVAVRKQKLLALYSTPLLDREPNRVHNIRVTVQKLDGQKIDPGKVFSFNETVGQPTKTAGYKLATVLADDGSKIRELGGGMCQVSSTLYNVALEANLEIVERHPHAKPVKYVPEGRDATTYTDLDLKFRNSTDKVLFLRGTVGKDRVQLWLY